MDGGGMSYEWYCSIDLALRTRVWVRFIHDLQYRGELGDSGLCVVFLPTLPKFTTTGILHTSNCSILSSLSTSHTSFYTRHEHLESGDAV